MAYGEFYVERQGWARWPKVLLMCRKRGNGVERRRYVPDPGTCRYEFIANMVIGEVSLDCCGLRCDRCGREQMSLDPPRYCPDCGRRTENE